MGNRISLSQEVFGIEEVAVSHLDFDRSIRFYYSNPSTQQLDPKFVGYSPIELEQERDERLEELDKNSAFMVLTAVEARLKVDFLLRCKQRKKDSLSEHYQSIRKTKGDNISFEETILDGWKTHYPHSKALMSALKGAFNFRNWIAHGRYWVPKFGRKYDFSTVYDLADEIHKLPLLSE